MSVRPFVKLLYLDISRKLEQVLKIELSIVANYTRCSSMQVTLYIFITTLRPCEFDRHTHTQCTTHYVLLAYVSDTLRISHVIYC